MARHTLLDFFEDMTAQDDLFIVHDDGYRVRRMTYREMGVAAHTFAAALASRGIGADDKVVVWSENRPEWVVAMWGTLLTRAVLVPVDFRASAELVNKIASIVDAKLILVGAEVDAGAVRGSTVERIDSFPTANPDPGFRNAPKAGNAEPGTLAEIIFTSGATAEPKGVTNHPPQRARQHRPHRGRGEEVPEVHAAVPADPVPESAADEPHVRPVHGHVHSADAGRYRRLLARL
jgi:long-subunit acyl-CoA synthetase (AMP-forming)